MAVEASKRKLALSEYASRLLATRYVPANKLPKTGAELVAYWQKEGVIGSRTDITDSQAYARNLRRQAENRASE